MEEENDDRDDTKRRSRNLSEKKRRDQFNSLVNDLSALISTSNRKMDKSTVLKSTIAFLKHHNEATDRSKVFEIEQDWKPSFLSNDEFTQLMLESLDGFIIVFGSRGSIFYTSDSITAQLGYLPCDLNKRTIFDLAYETDHENLLNVFLNHKPVIEPMQTDINSRNQITFFVHLKRGGVDDRNTCNTYELVKFVGYFRNDANVETLSATGNVQNTQSTVPRILQIPAAKEIDKKLIFVGTGRLQMPHLIREITITDPTRNEFTSKHSMEWKFLFLDHRAPPIIGYMPFEVLGTSGYDYYHFDDIDDIVACHEELMQSGKGKSGYYRFLTKGQQWIWLQTDFFVSYNQFNAKPEYVVCTHKVVNYVDVLKNQKRHQQNLMPNINPTDKLKSPASGKHDLESSSCHLDAVTATPTSTPALAASNSGIPNKANLISDMISNENSPNMDALWTNVTTPTGTSNSQINPLKSASRPPSNYGNISSTGVSPNVKRKRYQYHYRGNDSDSTSMSADSGTSRHSLMTHLSSSRQRILSSIQQQNPNSSGSQHQQQHHHQQQKQHSMSVSSNQLPHMFNHQHQQQQPQSIHNQQQTHQQLSMQLNSSSGHQGDQKILPTLPQHSLLSMTPSNSCQFSQPPFPLRNPQIVTPTFLEPSQYLTAIPVQQVIAPFPVGPVLSPLPNQSDMLAGPVIMTSTQSQLQEQLQRKHDELQKLIMQQQDELRIVSEQLLLARYTLLQPVMPVNYNTPVTVGNNTRNYNFNSNTVQPQFNQYGFAMNSGEMQNQQDQQVMLQQQHNLQQQMHQNHAQQQQSTQQLHQAIMQTHTNQNEQQQQQHHIPPTTESLIMNRPVPDLDQFAQEEFDAFLNLSPLQSMEGSTSNLNPLSSVNNNTQLPNQNIPNNPNSTNPSAKSSSANIQPASFNNNPQNSEDSLLSYMQMATESSPALNFNMGISDDVSESRNEASKTLQNPSTQQLPTAPVSNQVSLAQPQQRSPAFFPTHNYQNLSVPNQAANATCTSNNNSVTTHPNHSATDPLPSDLEVILPYQMSQGQSPNLFNTNNSNPTGTSQ